MTTLNNHNSVSIGLVQWYVRAETSWASFEERTTAQVRAMAKADFVLFPEYFTIPLTLLAPAEDDREEMIWLGRRAELIRDHFSRLAQRYEVNIIAGSTPEWADGKLYNTSYVCHRDGRIDAYRKVHLTPYEVSQWDMVPGDRPGLILTDRGYIGVCICYDVEFPELPRLYAEAGARLLFVPYSTDTEYGHHRVTQCARARALENECYVAAAGCVGNIPEVRQLEFQFAQSAVFTPSDYGFPFRGIAAEAPPNVDAAFRVTLDMGRLTEQHHHGSVKTLSDRRTDLYHLSWQKGLRTESEVMPVENGKQ